MKSFVSFPRQNVERLQRSASRFGQWSILNCVLRSTLSTEDDDVELFGQKFIGSVVCRSLTEFGFH